jgi:hypothetical protein
LAIGALRARAAHKFQVSEPIHTLLETKRLEILHLKRRRSVPDSHQQQTSGIAVLGAFGVICAILLGFVVWHPPAARWLAESTQAEFSNAPAEAAPVRLAGELMRKPQEARQCKCLQTI